MLDTIVASVRKQISVRSRPAWKAEIESRLRTISSCPGKSFRDTIATSGETLICEIKRKAPSTPGSPLDIDPAATARLYEDAGSDAISVLTEPEYFAGSLADLDAVVNAMELPVLRKDFIVDELQILEARAHGASAVLLIVAVLDQPTLSRLLSFAAAEGLDAIVEVHDRTELHRALELRAPIIGVNNRNLKTMKIDLTIGARLLSEIPRSTLKVAESGIRDRADLIRLRAAGADAFLIGTAIMSSTDITAKIRELRGL